LKEKKKRLDGIDSEGSVGCEDEREQIQTGSYDSLTPLGTTTCTLPTQTKGTPETEQIERELNNIELNNTNTSPLKNEYIKRTTDSSELQGDFTNLRSGNLVDYDNEIELDSSSEDEDSLGDISHMEENSLSTCFNVSVNEEFPARPEQSANQAEILVDPEQAQGAPVG
jgi:hypothetical protein